MLAWLAIQAGWKDHETAGNLTFRTSSGAVISANLTADSCSAPLSSLVLRAGAGAVSVTQASGAFHLVRQIEASGYRATSLSPADPTSAAELVALQLARGGKNSLYQKILPRFRAMLDYPKL